MSDLDLVRAHGSEYGSTREPALVKTAPARYLAVEGAGTPGDAAFQEAVGALFQVAWTLKMSKPAPKRWKIPPLEGLWWRGRLAKGKWHWKLLLRVPDTIGGHDVFDAAMRAGAKKTASPALGKVELEAIDEGTCVQMTHVGPWSEEAASIAKMEAFEKAHRLRARGAHHEIYWNDPRRTRPERLKTTIRRPVRPV